MDRFTTPCRRTAAALSLALAVFVRTGPARAEQTPALSLEWVAPPGCGSSDDIRRRAETLLGGPIEPRLHHPLRAVGTVTEENGRFALHLETLDDGLAGERALDSATCDELVSATALIVALAIDPKAVASRSGSTGESTPGDDAAPTPATAPPVVVAPRGATPERPAAHATPLTVSTSAELGVALDVGALPSVGVGPLAAFAITLDDHVRLRVGAAYYVPQTATATASGTTGVGARGADVSLAVGDVSGCYVIRLRPIDVAGCADFEGGAFIAEGTGFVPSNDVVRAWFGGGASADVKVTLSGPFALRVGGGVLAPFGRSRVRFVEKTGNVSEIRDIYRPSSISGRFTATLGMTF